VVLYPERDDMATLSATLPAATGARSGAESAATPATATPPSSTQTATQAATDPAGSRADSANAAAQSSRPGPEHRSVTVQAANRCFPEVVLTCGGRAASACPVAG
jgi:hypothetical protein